ncbi:MAG TPA: hypothetical protein VEN31_05965 [Candidatus Bathyarchaeia archaeon]|nr:hypothetical protein [Candidatus Bathyarchaeia archaeon]
MTRLFGFKQKVAALAIACLVLSGVSALAWFVDSNGQISLCISKDSPHPVRALDTSLGEECGPAEDLVVINQQGPAGPAGPAGPTGATGSAGPAGPNGVTNVLAVHRNNGPASPNSSFLVVLTLPNVPPGNYVALAKTNLRGQTNLNNGMQGAVDDNAFCQLSVTPAGGTTLGVDSWSETAGGVFVANLQRPIALNPSIATSYTVQLACNVGDIAGWNASASSIILIPATSLNENETNN